jgi:hypothetical protein
LSSRKRWLSPPHPCTKRCRILRRPDIAPSASRLTRPGSPKGGENLSRLFLDVCAHSLSRPRVSYVGCARSSCLECLLELGAWCFQTSVPNMPGQPPYTCLNRTFERCTAAIERDIRPKKTR